MGLTAFTRITVDPKGAAREVWVWRGPIALAAWLWLAWRTWRRGQLPAEREALARPTPAQSVPVTPLARYILRSAAASANLVELDTIASTIRGLAGVERGLVELNGLWVDVGPNGVRAADWRAVDLPPVADVRRWLAWGTVLPIAIWLAVGPLGLVLDANLWWCASRAVDVPGAVSSVARVAVLELTGDPNDVTTWTTGLPAALAACPPRDAIIAIDHEVHDIQGCAALDTMALNGRRLLRVRRLEDGPCVREDDAINGFVAAGFPGTFPMFPALDDALLLRPDVPSTRRVPTLLGALATKLIADPGTSRWTSSGDAWTTWSLGVDLARPIGPCPRGACPSLCEADAIIAWVPPASGPNPIGARPGPMPEPGTADGQRARVTLLPGWGSVPMAVAEATQLNAMLSGDVPVPLAAALVGLGHGQEVPGVMFVLVQALLFVATWAVWARLQARWWLATAVILIGSGALVAALASQGLLVPWAPSVALTVALVALSRIAPADGG